MRITLLTYGSLLSYCPRGSSPTIEQSRDLMKSIKADEYISKPPISASDWITKIIHDHVDKLPFANFFEDNTVLIPAPSSSLMQPNSLWVPDRIAKALVRKGIGKEVVTCLVRKRAVPKSAFSKASERPKVKEHIASMAVQGLISESLPNDIVLVDDIITRGATLLGGANILAEALPKAQIRAFAAMRTISDSSDFVSLSAPVVGTIQYRPQNDDTLRRP